jgi:hypothetical protein
MEREKRTETEIMSSERKRWIEEKNRAYLERDKLVAFLARLYPAHLKRHPEGDDGCGQDWMNVVCVHSPAGQLTWHVHDSEMKIFDFLDQNSGLFADCEWDGHTTEEKYKRLANLP